MTFIIVTKIGLADALVFDLPRMHVHQLFVGFRRLINELTRHIWTLTRSQRNGVRFCAAKQYKSPSFLFFTPAVSI
jgi:hypothetical protein